MHRNSKPSEINHTKSKSTKRRHIKINYITLKKKKPLGKTETQISTDNLSCPSQQNTQLDIKRTHLIGEGAFSQIYHATIGNQSVAVKVVKEERIPFEDKKRMSAMDCLKQEAKVLADLKMRSYIQSDGYQYLVAYYSSSFSEYATLDGITCNGEIILEFLEEGDLREWINGSQLNSALNRHFMENITHGLQYLHCHNYIYADLKAENIMVKKEAENKYQYVVKLIDFGLSCKATEHLEPRGTPTYLAPEVLDGEPNSKASDIWSLSATFWEMWNPGQIFPNGYDDIHSINELYTYLITQKIEIPASMPPKIAHLITLGFKQNAIDRPTADEMLKALPTLEEAHENAGHVLKVL